MKVSVVAGCVLSLLCLSKGEFHTTNAVSETTLVKSSVVMCGPYNDAFTSLLRLGGMDEDAEMYRHNGAFDFNRHVGLFAHFEVRVFEPKVPIFDLSRFRSGQVESVVSTVVTNAMPFSEAILCLREVKNLLTDEHVDISFVEQQKGRDAYEIRSEKPGKEGWNIYLTVKKVDGNLAVLGLLFNRSVCPQRKEDKEVQVDVDI